jgi:hypothetical protein
LPPISKGINARLAFDCSTFYLVVYNAAVLGIYYKFNAKPNLFFFLCRVMLPFLLGRALQAGLFAITSPSAFYCSVFLIPSNRYGAG